MPDYRRNLRHSMITGIGDSALLARYAQQMQQGQVVPLSGADAAAAFPFFRAGMVVKHAEASKKGNEIEAIISTFNVPVSSGFPWMPDDVLLSGSVAASLERGFPAVVFSHMFEENPPIGVTLDIEERGDDLYAKGRLFVEENQTAREVFTAMSEKGGDGRPPLREFSISGPIIKWTMDEEEEVREIVELDLWEWGPCLRGANTTQLISVDGDTVEQKRRVQRVAMTRREEGLPEVDTDETKKVPPEQKPAESVPESAPPPPAEPPPVVQKAAPPAWFVLPIPSHR